MVPLERSLAELRKDPRPAAARSPARVFLASGSRLLTEAVSAALDAREEIDVVGACVEPKSLVSELRALPVDVVLVEASLGNGVQLRTIRLLRDQFPELGILPLGVSGVAEIVRCAEAGASGYVLRGASIPDLVNIIDSVRHNRTPCSPKVAASVFKRISELTRRFDKPPRAPRGTTTPRETEILKLVAAGLRNKEIAARLGISISTVKNHMHGILSKLRVKGRRQAVAAAIESGILSRSSVLPRQSSLLD